MSPAALPELTVILLHGRGGTREEMLSFAVEHLPVANYLAVQAPGNAWYPQPFTAPRERNEPWLTQSLARIDSAITEAGVPRTQIVLLGFSQGACLALEYVARHPGQYAGVLAFSGGLIGARIEPPAEGSLNGTPIVLSCSEQDPYIPLERVKASATVLHQAGASVQLFAYPGNSHTITEHELALAAMLIGPHNTKR